MRTAITLLLLSFVSCIPALSRRQWDIHGLRPDLTSDEGTAIAAHIGPQRVAAPTFKREGSDVEKLGHTVHRSMNTTLRRCDYTPAIAIPGIGPDDCVELVAVATDL